MFKNWSNTNKTIAAVVALALVAFVLYELKVFGNTTSLLNLRGANTGNGGSVDAERVGGTNIVETRGRIKSSSCGGPNRAPKPCPQAGEPCSRVFEDECGDKVTYSGVYITGRNGGCACKISS